jgi:hypothetical protein
LVSYLGGERWSDLPACTHSLLASVARLVNDHTSDEGRPQLAELIPAVKAVQCWFGKADRADRGRPEHRCLGQPPAREDRAAGCGSRSTAVLAVSVLVCERVLARLDGRGGNSLSADSERALGAVPEAAHWARHFTRQVGPRLAAFRRQSAPDAVRYAVEGAAHALIPDPDVLLRRMLVESIDICAAWTGKAASGVGVDGAAWAEACRLTVAADGG